MCVWVCVCVRACVRVCCVCVVLCVCARVTVVRSPQQVEVLLPQRDGHPEGEGRRDGPLRWEPERKVRGTGSGQRKTIGWVILVLISQ